MLSLLGFVAKVMSLMARGCALILMLIVAYAWFSTMYHVGVPMAISDGHKLMNDAPTLVDLFR